MSNEIFIGEKSALCRVLIVEDDASVADSLKRVLSQAAIGTRFRFEISITSNIRFAINQAKSNSIDIFVVDLGLDDPNNPNRNSPNVGMRYIPQLSEYKNSGIIIYSSEDKENYYEKLLDIGADDYIQKTDSYSFVVKKIVALWRRTVSLRADAVQLATGFDRSFRIGNWTFSVGNQILKNVDGKTIHVGPTEYELVKCLCNTKGMTLSEEEIGVFVFKRRDFEIKELRKSLENLLYRVRKKFGEDVIIYIGEGKYKINAEEISQGR